MNETQVIPKVEKGFWTYICCEEDLHQIVDDAEVAALIERLAEADDGTLRDKVFPTLAETVRSILESEKLA